MRLKDLTVLLIVLLWNPSVLPQRKRWWWFAVLLSFFNWLTLGGGRGGGGVGVLHGIQNFSLSYKNGGGGGGVLHYSFLGRF